MERPSEIGGRSRSDEARGDNLLWAFRSRDPRRGIQIGSRHPSFEPTVVVTGSIGGGLVPEASWKRAESG